MSILEEIKAKAVDAPEEKSAPAKRTEADYGEHVCVFDGSYVGETRKGKPSISLRFVTDKNEICYGNVYYEKPYPRHLGAAMIADLTRDVGEADTDVAVIEGIEDELVHPQNYIIQMMREIKEMTAGKKYRINYSLDDNGFKRLTILETVK